MPKWLILALLPVTLSACQTAAERRAEIYDKCFHYGFRAGTTAHSQCLMGLDQQAEARDFQRRQAIVAGLSELGSSMKPVQVQTPPKVHCTSRRTIPGTVETDCQ